PIDMPEGEAYLQFEQWHNLEKYDSGSAYDFGHVFVSTDQEEWTQLMQVEGESDGWESAEVDLSEYSGQRIYIGFNVTTDGSVTREGWYIDDVALSDTSQSSKVSLGKNDGKGKANGHNNRLFPGALGLGLGVIKADEKAGLKERVDPNQIRPALPEEKDLPEDGDVINPNLLPISAEVNVLESGRAVITDPATGEDSMTHAAGA